MFTPQLQSSSCTHHPSVCALLVQFVCWLRVQRTRTEPVTVNTQVLVLSAGANYGLRLSGRPQKKTNMSIRHTKLEVVAWKHKYWSYFGGLQTDAYV